MKVRKSADASSTTPVFAGFMVLVSSACCVGPLAVVLTYVGLSSSTLLAVENVFGPFRPYILLVTAGVLAFGFRAAYRKDTACEAGQVCAIPATQRVQRVMLWFALGFLSLLLYFSYIHPNLDLWFDIYL